VKAATAQQTSNGSNPQSDWDQGYGYQFWRCRHGAYRGDGAFGQFCIVLPQQDAVVAITSGTRDMQAVLNLIWDKLLPALSAGPQPADEKGNQILQARLTRLKLPTLEGSARAQVPEDGSGKTYTFPANDQKLESLGVEFVGNSGDVTLVCKSNRGAIKRILCGGKDWNLGRFAFGTTPEQPAAACGAWTENNVYTAKICFYETPYIVTLRMDLSEGQLKLDTTWNVSFGPSKKPQLVGARK
jgi:hypothetical protein